MNQNEFDRRLEEEYKKQEQIYENQMERATVPYDDYESLEEKLHELEEEYKRQEQAYEDQMERATVPYDDYESLEEELHELQLKLTQFQEKVKECLLAKDLESLTIVLAEEGLV